LHAHNRETHHPVDDGLGARGLADAQPVCEYMQDARNSAKADAGAGKQGEGQPHPLRLEDGGPGLFVAQVLFGLFEGLFGAIALCAQALDFFAQVAIVLGSFFGLVFPLLAALFEFGLLAHPVPPLVKAQHPGRWTLWNPADQDSEAQVAMHHESEWGSRPK
jgi:hypothetical protein